jgi:hypothetical protein
MDLEILAKEKSSVHSPNLFVNNLESELDKMSEGLSKGTVYRLYKLNRLMTAV